MRWNLGAKTLCITPILPMTSNQRDALGRKERLRRVFEPISKPLAPPCFPKPGNVPWSFWDRLY